MDARTSSLTQRFGAEHGPPRNRVDRTVSQAVNAEAEACAFRVHSFAMSPMLCIVEYDHPASSEATQSAGHGVLSRGTRRKVMKDEIVARPDVLLVLIPAHQTVATYANTKEKFPCPQEPRGVGIDGGYRHRMLCITGIAS